MPVSGIALVRHPTLKNDIALILHHSAMMTLLVPHPQTETELAHLPRMQW